MYDFHTPAPNRVEVALCTVINGVESDIRAFFYTVRPIFSGDSIHAVQHPDNPHAWAIFHNEERIGKWIDDTADDVVVHAMSWICQ
jgi:hypothetical protein